MTLNKVFIPELWVEDSKVKTSELDAQYVRRDGKNFQGSFTETVTNQKLSYPITADVDMQGHKITNTIIPDKSYEERDVPSCWWVENRDLKFTIAHIQQPVDISQYNNFPLWTLDYPKKHPVEAIDGNITVHEVGVYIVSLKFTLKHHEKEDVELRLVDTFSHDSYITVPKYIPKRDTWNTYEATKVLHFIGAPKRLAVKFNKD